MARTNSPAITVSQPGPGQRDRDQAEGDDQAADDADADPVAVVDDCGAARAAAASAVWAIRSRRLRTSSASYRARRSSRLSRVRRLRRSRRRSPVRSAGHLPGRDDLRRFRRGLPTGFEADAVLRVVVEAGRPEPTVRSVHL